MRLTATKPAKPGWFADPFDRHERRYHNGGRWTGYVDDGNGVAWDEPKSDDNPVPQRDGRPTCSHCNGTLFVPRRLTSTKIAFGLLSLAGRPRHVECVTCGTLYTRPNPNR